jgi:hypothetical protein
MPLSRALWRRNKTAVELWVELDGDRDRDDLEADSKNDSSVWLLWRAGE